MRLIDADVLKYVKFHGVADWTPTEEASYQLGWNDAIDAIMRNAPTVDAVPLEDYKSMEQTVNKLTKAIADSEPVVRCKDCVFCKRFNDVWYVPKSDELLCTLYVETYHTTENDYCSRGIRKDD